MNTPQFACHPDTANTILSELATNYEIEDVKLIGASKIELDCEIEPLGVALRIDIILQNQVILQLLFLPYIIITFIAMNKLPDS